MDYTFNVRSQYIYPTCIILQMLKQILIRTTYTQTLPYKALKVQHYHITNRRQKKPSSEIATFYIL